MTTQCEPARDGQPRPLNAPIPDWDTVMALSWRPAWHIRSRRGTLTLLLAWWADWRNRRASRR